MQPGIELPTTTQALKERLYWLGEALSTCRRARARKILQADRDAAYSEIQRRRLLQTTLENL